MAKIKSCIQTYSDNQHTFTKLRYAKFSKVIQLRLNVITAILKVGNNLLDGFFLVGSQQTFHILSNKNFRFFCIYKT